MTIVFTSLKILEIFLASNYVKRTDSAVKSTVEGQSLAGQRYSSRYFFDERRSRKSPNDGESCNIANKKRV